MALLRNRASFIWGGSTESKKAQTGSKVVRTSSCRPPPTRNLSSRNPIHLANELLESAYALRKGWDGADDLPQKAAERQHEQLRDAVSAKEWTQAADKLDLLEGNHYWKFDEESDDCDLELVRTRLDRLKQANHENDMEEMLVQIRNGLKRDLGGMCNPRLYQHTWLGTKHLIEEYTDVVKYTIERIAKFCETADVPTVNRYLETVKAARQSFGNSALMLSGGGTLGMCHIGVVKSLLEAGLLPKVVCGASAGSIVASVLCTHKGAELIDKLDELCSGDLSVFQSPDEWQGIPGMAVNIFKGASAFDVSNLCRVMKGLLGDITFKEAYNYTGMALNIHVSCRDRHNLPRILNYVTSPNVVIWSAVASSCALPFVFEAPGLRAKNLETLELEPWGHFDHEWIDGSIEGDLPAQILQRLFNVNNFIASQVNPHIGPFLPKEGEEPGFYRKWLRMSSANIVYTLDGVMDRGYDPFPVKMIHSVLSQKYDGDITILPDISWVPLIKILANPTQAFMIRATQEGERATWPKLDRIHNSVAIELALDTCIHQMQTRKVEGLMPHRVPSATRSVHGMGLLRRKSGGPGSVQAVPRVPRGRASLHRPARSLVEPFQTLNAPSSGTTATATHRASDPLLSSSDEATRSGQSSPITSWDEGGGGGGEGRLHGCNDDDDDKESDFTDDDWEPTEEERRTLAFLSQPASPSLSKRSFWGTDASSHPPPTTTTAAATAALNPRPHGYHSPVPLSPPSPAIRRALSGLHMSKLNSVVNFVDRDRGRRH